MKPETTIEGVLERIIYSNEENAWSVVRLMVRGRGQVTAVGNLLGVQPGESLRLTGRWHSDRKYGEQFKVGSYLTIKPSTFVGIEKYLSSGLVKGIGPEMARRLVQHFGLDTLEVIDHEPGRLTEVGGIGPVRSARIREAWREQSEIREVVIFLQSHGVSTAHAVKIYKQYGADAVAVVRRNPYCLAREVYGIGFATADKIARDIGIPVDSPERAAAGALYTLSRAADDGHMYLSRQKLVDEVTTLLEVAAEVVDPAVTALVEGGELVAVEVPELAQQAIYLAPLETAERGAAELLKALTAQQLLPLSIDVERAVRWFEEREKIELAPEQCRALERAIASKVMVLTGGPGTGKTMLMRGIVNIMTRKGLRVELAAPTGRAAKRLSEATGFEARTVHRLLEFNPNKGGFVRGPDNPLEIDLLVVDEASMLDTVLSYHILKAMPREARLILVGDIDQLPSVGPGRVLADLIESQALEVVRLTEIFR
ncbi:MAG: AAA family ATPase, partial [bacterium]|nr:AAA family ATPase [bacterium]